MDGEYIRITSFILGLTKMGGKFMRKLIGTFDLISSLAFFIMGGMSLIGIPSQFADRTREPEDFYGLIFIFCLVTVTAFVFLSVGLRLLREQPYSWQTTPILWVAGIASGLVLLAIASLDLFGPIDPGTFGLRLLFVPALVMAISVIYAVVESRRIDV